MNPGDVATTLQRVAALRALCLRLPHLPTPAETKSLERFAALVASPPSATDADIEAVAAGWRRWWQDDQADRILAMAARLPEGFADLDRRLASYLTAAARREPGGRPESGVMTGVSRA